MQWGPAQGATAGELLRLSYSADEPIAQASLRLADGRVLAFAIAPDELTVLLPADTPDGWATVSWADDVGNQDTRAIQLRGALVVTPPPPAVTPPSPPARLRAPGRAERHRVIARTRVTVHSRAVTRRAGRDFTDAPVTATARLRARRVARVAWPGPTATVVRHASIRQHTVAAAASTARVRRRDDGDVEALLLDLL